MPKKKEQARKNGKVGNLLKGRFSTFYSDFIFSCITIQYSQIIVLDIQIQKGQYELVTAQTAMMKTALIQINPVLFCQTESTESGKQHTPPPKKKYKKYR